MDINGYQPTNAGTFMDTIFIIILIILFVFYFIKDIRDSGVDAYKIGYYEQILKDLGVDITDVKNMKFKDILR
jgi:hypothetical protein